MLQEQPYENLYWIDLFCGAGGTSTGIHLAGSKVVACVNHDHNAIKSHSENHPDAHHFTEDIRDFSVVLKLKALVEEIRRQNPNAIIAIWASLECTHFSRAASGPRDADSRTLAEHMFMYLIELNPEYFWVENVKEFLSWGPLDENGYPIKERKSEFYNDWVAKVKTHGFNYDKKLLNSADYGSYQSRERLFIQFVKESFPFSWPAQTHCEAKHISPLFPLKKWNAVRDILDLHDEGKSIFERKKPLVDNTLKVIKNGIIKAIKEQETGFLFKYYGTGDNLNSFSKPAGTVTTKDRFAKVHVIFNQYKNGNISSINNPAGTVTTTPKANLVSFIFNPSYGGHTSSVNKPCPTVIARQDKAPLSLIRVLMDEYGISDIKMRMLNMIELKQLQGFPKDYKLIGTQAEQKKQIGNAVEVNQAKAIVKAKVFVLQKHFGN
jgi:DNA (cytosine-5)-methyltransferase 1